MIDVPDKVMSAVLHRPAPISPISRTRNSGGRWKRISRTVDLAGRRFGKLLAVAPTKQRLYGSIVWQCACQCGREAHVCAAELMHGKRESCDWCAAPQSEPLEPSVRDPHVFARLDALMARGLGDKPQYRMVTVVERSMGIRATIAPVREAV